MDNLKPVNIYTTLSFNKTIDNSITYLSQWNEEPRIINRIESALERFEAQIVAQPFSYSRCPELIECCLYQ